MSVDVVQNACLSLKSPKVGDRKKAAEAILDLIGDREDVCRNLDSNSMQKEKDKDKLTWTSLFNEVREYFAKETEKLSTSHGGNTSKNFCISVVDRVLHKGTCHRPWIHWNKIFDFILVYLNQDVYANVYGTSLISMLQHFLSIELYVSIVDAASWTEMIKLLIKVFGKYDIPGFMVLQCLNTSIQEGSNHPAVIQTLRTDVVRFYESLFSTDRSRVRPNVVLLLRGVTTLCRKNSVEFRGILCKLGESMIPNVLHSSSYMLEEEGAIIELLSVQLQLHSPCNVDLNSPAFYADNPKKWSDILKSIYMFCLDALDDIANKKLSHFHKDLQVSEKLIHLAAKCTKQICDSQAHETTSSGDEDEPNPAKKAMRCRSFNSVLSDACGKPPNESQIVWMNYLTAVLTEFPSLTSSRINFSSLFSMGLNFLNSSFVTRKEVYLFFLCLLRTEKYLVKEDILKSRSKSWENVWDVTVRSLSINDAKLEAMELLKNLLVEVQPSNVNSLLVLFANGTIPPNSTSLYLLEEFLSRCTLPLFIGSSEAYSNKANIGVEIASTACPRWSLIRWLLKFGDEPFLGDEPVVAALLCSLLVRQTHNLVQSEKNVYQKHQSPRLLSELHQFESVQDDFEKVLVKCCFVNPPEEKELPATCSLKNGSNEALPLSLIPSIPGRLVDALQDDSDKPLVIGPIRSEFIKNFSLLSYRVALHLNILNVLEKHTVGGSDGSSFRTNVEKLFDSALGKCMEFATDYIGKGKEKTASQVQELIVVMRNILRSDFLCDKIKTVLAQRFPQQMQELLKKTYRSNLTRYIERAANNNNAGDTVMFGGQDWLSRLYFSSMSGGDDAGISEHRQIELAALEGLGCLLDYGSICDHKVDLCTEIIKDCMMENYSPAIPFTFEFSAELISRLTPMLKDECTEMLTLVTNLLQKMCRGFYQVPYCSTRLWELFSEITRFVAVDSEVNKKNLMILIGALSGFMKSPHPYGSSITICQTAFKAINEIAKGDPHISWSVFIPKSPPATPVWILYESHEFLTHHSHQIRVFASEAICAMYTHGASPILSQNEAEDVPGTSTSNGHGASNKNDKRVDHFVKVHQYIQKVFEIPISVTPLEIAEEGVNRTSIALSTLTRLIFAYPFIQKKALFCLLQLVKEKGVDLVLAKRALDFASSTALKTMCCHISYLLQQWMQSGFGIEEFPYIFFDCSGRGDFFSKFRKEISLEYFQKNDMAGLKKFSEYLNTTSVDLVKGCYGMLMARIVPGISIYKHKNLPLPKDVTQLQDTQKRLTITLGGKSQTESLMMTALGDVVLQLVSLVFDPQIPSAWGCQEIRLPEPTPPFHDEDSIDTCLNFLKDISTRKDISVIAFLATSSPQCIYGNLLTLITRAHNAHDVYEKFRRLHQFSYFVKQLLQEPQLIFNTMKEYVCQFVVYAYLRLLNAENGTDSFSPLLRKALVFLISEFVLNLTLSYKDEMKHFYYPVVNGLVSCAIKYRDLITAVKPPLDMLLKNYRDDFAECIVSLDPFPLHIPEFDEYREIYWDIKYGKRRTEWTLLKELQSCLQEIQTAEGSCTKERLEFLKDLLGKKKRDLEKIVKNLEGKKFSDECSSDKLHNLIQVLVGVIKSGDDEVAVLEACRCLGEIGPVDLAVMVLPESTCRKEIKGTFKGVSTIIEIAAEYLKVDDIGVVRTTGEVLKAACQIGECCDMPSNPDMARTRIDLILKPFKPSEAPKKSQEKVLPNLLETKLGMIEMNEFISFPEWITQVTCGLIESLQSGVDSLTSSLLPLCKLRVDFCQQVFPFIFYVTLFAGRLNPLVRKTLSGYFRNFLNKFTHNHSNLSETTRSFTPLLGCQNEVSIYMNKLALRSLLGVIQFLRNHRAPQDFKGVIKVTPWDNNFWLDVNYLDLAKAAQHCGAYLSSILYAEIAATDLEFNGPIHLDGSGEDDLMESFYSQGTSFLPRSKAENIEKLLLKAYTSIGEPDAVYGCGSARFSDNQMNVRHLQQRMLWGRVLSACDGNLDTEMALEAESCDAMKEMGLYNTLWTYLQGIEAREKTLDPELSEIQYECGWRLSKWNLHCDKASYVKDDASLRASKKGGFLQKFIYESVQTGLENDIVNHTDNVKLGYLAVARELRHASIESSENLYGFLCKLQMLRMVDDFFQQESQEGMTGVDSFLMKWKTQDKIPISDFKFQEPIVYLRGVLLRSYEDKNPRQELETAYEESMLDLLAKARDSGRIEFAENCAACVNSSSSDKILKKDLEIAKNHWARGDQDIARHILGRILKKTSSDSCDLYPVMLLMYGEWLSETMSERPSVILEKYLLRSCQIYEKRGTGSHVDMAKAHFVLAKYADEQYQNVSKYIKSEFFCEKVQHFEKAKVDVAAIQSTSDLDARKSALVLKKQTDIEHEEIQGTIAERQKFLILALRHYLVGLKDSNDQDLLVFRAVALWLENGDSADPKCSTDVNTVFKQELMPSYKYILVLHQLSARMGGNTRGMMADILSKILLRCAHDHPYHTLPVLLTQALLHKDQEVLSSVPYKKHLEDRVKAASKLVEVVQKDRNLGPLAKKMEELWVALISLANCKEHRATNTTGQFNLPESAPLRSLRGLISVAVPTSTVPLSMSAEYKDSFIGIVSFDDKFNFVGGINSPKRISCVGANGMRFNMLLKGQDDLRQDAVMQQVFGVMNKLLLAEPKTKARRLHVRTYKVVPLSQRSGILEWCENTQTFGDYLVNTENGAHAKYRPNDFSPMDCRRKMIGVKDCGDNEKKYGTFMTILEHFKPVFRHFFFENFKEAGTFFERRLAYTRSVATNSMVGYILGLGDRHVLNILVDKTTAEFIHIDLGVAFEQGRILPTPETIPFRLTRDVVDGMGVSGVEGVFRKSCEMTLEVLRKNSDIILTILEVLLYDPLYMWTLTADRMRKVQPSDSGRAASKRNKKTVENTEDGNKERNSSAARVLLRLKQKLAGIEEGGSSGSVLSVPGHVSLLIQQAMDPERLSRLFSGWQPYL